jgi:hypothetical protein
MRNLVAVKDPSPPSPPAMSCADVRTCLSALLEGPIALTERALAEVHLEQCAACREHEARLRERVAARRLVTRRRAALVSFGKTVALIRASVIGPTLLIVRRRAPLTPTAHELPLRAIALRAIAGATKARRLGRRHVVDLSGRLRASIGIARGPTARTTAGAIEAIEVGIARLVAGIAHVRGWPATARRSSVRAGARAIEALRRGVTRPARRLAALCSARVIASRPPVRVAQVLVLVGALAALQPSDRPEQPARSVPPPRAELPTTLLEPVPPVPLPPPPPSEEASRAPAPAPRAAAPAPPRGRAFEAALPAVPEAEPVVGPTHVVGRLSARERSAAERDFSALLAGVGGTELGRRHRVGFTALNVVVPHSRYIEFALGLARIGSWRLEAERVPLPDAVHMTIHVSE